MNISIDWNTFNNDVRHNDVTTAIKAELVGGPTKISVLGKLTVESIVGDTINQYFLTLTSSGRLVLSRIQQEEPPSAA